MDDHEDIGYLKRAVEELTASTKILHQIVKDHMAREEEDRKELIGMIKRLETRVVVLEEESRTNKAILEVLKKIGLVVVAIFLLNLGDYTGLLKLF